MADQLVKVSKKGVTKEILFSKLKIFQRMGWKLVDSQVVITSAPEKKKEDVKLVADPGEAPVDETQSQAPEQPAPFAKVDTDQVQEAETPSIEALQEEYQILSGKAADKRWKGDRLNDEIAKLKPVEHAD